MSEPDHLPPGDDEARLQWLAYRYASADLSAAEMAEFENRLDGDQQAREAVAQAVELSQIVRQLPVEAFDSPTIRARWLQPVGWMSLGAAACLAVVMAWHALQPSQDSAGQFGSEPATVADAWRQWREDPAAAWPAPLTADVSARADQRRWLETESDFTAPDWLREAVGDEPAAPADATEPPESS